MTDGAGVIRLIWNQEDLSRFVRILPSPPGAWTGSPASGLHTPQSRTAWRAQTCVNNKKHQFCQKINRTEYRQETRNIRSGNIWQSCPTLTKSARCHWRLQRSRAPPRLGRGRQKVRRVGPRKSEIVRVSATYIVVRLLTTATASEPRTSGTLSVV